jgi:uncharacterized protein (DUF983 family)
MMAMACGVNPMAREATAAENDDNSAACLHWTWAMLLQRCPRCRTGRMFRTWLAMNDPCPVCGLIFQREEGYFLGAMYTSYVLSCGLLTAFYLVAAALLPASWDSILVALVALVPFVPLIPVVHRYSRVTWVYLDRAACPTELSAGPYEKLRLRESAKGDPRSRETANSPNVAPDLGRDTGSTRR